MSTVASSSFDMARSASLKVRGRDGSRGAVNAHYRQRDRFVGGGAEFDLRRR